MCSPFALGTFLSSSSVDRFFASEFKVREQDEDRLEEVERDELRERYFSAQVLGQVFLAYRVVKVQVKHAASVNEKRQLVDAWFYASSRALSMLVRPGDFAVCSNLSFAVVCCVVDANLHCQTAWPASLMTADRVVAALRGLNETATKEESIDFGLWTLLSCLPLVRACNRCAASQDPKKYGRPRICTYAPCEDGSSVTSCLACVKGAKTSECSLLFATVRLVSLLASAY